MLRYAIHFVMHILEMHRKYVAVAPNLVFLVGAYIDRPFYRMLADGRERCDVLNGL